jgi:hypothetical protein
MAVAATEEPRLLGSAPGVEDAAEIDSAVGEQGQPRGVDDDEEILRFMDSVDGYLLLMDSLSSALRQVLHQPVLLSNLLSTVDSEEHIDCSKVPIGRFRKEESMMLH